MVKNKQMFRTKRIEAILDASMALALNVGLRQTTMEAIAKEADIAKATLYSYFSDKEAIYRAITARFFAKLVGIVEVELAKETSLSDRIAMALSAKHRLVFRLFEGSPHKEEIFSEKSKFAGKEVAEFENWLVQKIATALLEGGHKEPQKYAQIIIACSEGISRSATNASQIGPAIRLVINKLLQ